MKPIEKKQRSLERLGLSPWQEALVKVSYGKITTKYQMNRLVRLKFVSNDRITLTSKGDYLISLLKGLPI